VYIIKSGSLVSDILLLMLPASRKTRVELHRCNRVAFLTSHQRADWNLPVLKSD